MEALSKELDSSPPYKKSAALGLFYKVSYSMCKDSVVKLVWQYFMWLQFYLSCIGDHCSAAVKSAASVLLRPVSSGSQTFPPDKSEFPVGEPIDKLAAKLQV